MTGQLGDWHEGGILPENDLVKGVAMGGDQLGTVLRPCHVAHLNDQPIRVFLKPALRLSLCGNIFTIKNGVTQTNFWLIYCSQFFISRSRSFSRKKNCRLLMISFSAHFYAGGKIQAVLQFFNHRRHLLHIYHSTTGT